MEPWIFESGLGVIVTIIGYFLRQKDAAQEKQIAALWQKHDDDAAKLQALELRIASEHYVKRELDAKFNQLDATFRDGLSTLGSKFDVLSDRLLEYIGRK